MLGEFGDNSCSLLISPAQLTWTLIQVLLMESAGRYSGKEEGRHSFGLPRGDNHVKLRQ